MASANNPWRVSALQSLKNRHFVITGANSGIGLQAARHLASRDATVTMACRTVSKAEAARAELAREFSAATLSIEALDLTSLKSIKAFADRLVQHGRPVDVLINNAGVMAPPYTLTEDGFEMQIGTNHLGHFALTAQLWPLLKAGKNPRVVSVSSVYHKVGTIHFDDLHSKKKYRKWDAYAQSKIANLYFTFELERRARASGCGVIAVACHPGYSATNLQTAGLIQDSTFTQKFFALGNNLLAQSAEQGALPTVYAAAAEGVQGGEFYGPDGFLELRGTPVLVAPHARAKDAQVAAKLWTVSQEATGVLFDT
jgi:NAD(P)-dependent dehydrogenase (short-subunit alcohol dehydrogenase family)